MGKHPILTICLAAGLLGALALWSVDAWGALPRGGDRPVAAMPSYLQDSLPVSSSSAPKPKPTAPHKSSATNHSPSYLPHEALGFFSGGVLARVLWSYMYGYPSHRPWSEGWPFGFLDILVLGAILFLGYRVLHPVKNQALAIPPPRFFLPPKMLPISYSVEPEAEEILARIGAADHTFSLTTFLEFAHRMILDMHTAWNRQELERIQDRVTPNMFHYLQMGLKLLDLKGETSRVDDLTLSQMVVTQARQEIDRDLITVWFQGKALEYILDKKSYKLQSGSMSYPMDLSEHWVFERPRGGQGWLLREVEEA